MNHIYKTVNRYYHAFESYEGIITLRSPWLLLSLASIFCMGYTFFWYMEFISDPLFDFSKKNRLLFTFGFEVIAIICWLRLQHLQEQKIIKNMQSKFNETTCNLTKLKSIWFEKTVGIKNTEYIDLAKNIDTFLLLKESHKSNLSITGREIGDLFFSPDSKNRVLAMFMGLCAVTMALCIAAGTNINTIFDLLKNENPLQLLFYTGFISVLIIGSFLVLRYLILLVYVALELLGGKVDGLNSKSKRRVSIFINQLLILHVIEKSKLKA